MQCRCRAARRAATTAIRLSVKAQLWLTCTLPCDLAEARTVVFSSHDERNSFVNRYKAEYDNFNRQYGTAPASGVSKYMAGQLNLAFDLTIWTRKEAHDALAA